MDESTSAHPEDDNLPKGNLNDGMQMESKHNVYAKREMKVRSYSRFDSKQDKREVRAAYLEQAKFCIEAYFDIIANGTLNEAADKLNQAAFCVQQAKKTNW